MIFLSDLDQNAHLFTRRSYHDLDSLRSVKVLRPEQMRIDVELCAQVLVMMRREEHLRNVVACLEVRVFFTIKDGRRVDSRCTGSDINTV